MRNKNDFITFPRCSASIASFTLDNLRKQNLENKVLKYKWNKQSTVLPQVVE
jgi:hypothetical protein